MRCRSAIASSGPATACARASRMQCGRDGLSRLPGMPRCQGRVARHKSNSRTDVRTEAVHRRCFSLCTVCARNTCILCARALCTGSAPLLRTPCASRKRCGVRRLSALFAFSLNFLGYIPTGDGLLCINGQNTKIVLASENHPKKTSEMTRKNVRDESARGARRGSKNVAEEREGNVKRRRPKGTGP